MLSEVFSGIRTQSFFQCLCWSCFGTEQGVKEGEKKCPPPSANIGANIGK